jgi:hypothetical protein
MPSLLEDDDDDDDVAKVSKNELSWYYVPHGCDSNSLFMWAYLSLFLPKDQMQRIQILYYNDHFGCIDMDENLNRLFAYILVRLWENPSIMVVNNSERPYLRKICHHQQ